MNNLQHPLVRVPIRYGVMGWLIQVGLFVILYFAGQNPLLYSRPLDFGFLLIPIMVFFAIKDFKANHNRGELRFWQGMTAGFITYFIIAIGSALFIWVFLSLVDREILQGYIDDRIQLLLDHQSQFERALGTELFEEQISKMQATTPGVVAWDDFWKKLTIGLFLTILISVILRK